MPMSGMNHLMSAMGIDPDKISEAIETAKLQLAAIEVRFQTLETKADLIIAKLDTIIYSVESNAEKVSIENGSSNSSASSPGSTC